MELANCLGAFRRDCGESKDMLPAGSECLGLSRGGFTTNRMQRATRPRAMMVLHCVTATVVREDACELAIG